jgi:anthranilate phosphoribosyltransferase
MIDVKHFVKEHAARNIPLSFDEAYALGANLIKVCHRSKLASILFRSVRLANIQSVALLTALHNQALYAWKMNGRRTDHALPEDSAEQIAGICAAVFEHDIAKSGFGFLSPNVPYAMDNCGMGGDLIVTANVSTLAAFIAAVAGIPMCKHGSPANADKGRHGSSDFIDLCGISRFATRDAVEKCVEDLGFGYTEALDVRYKHIHLQTHKIAMLPHMNDIIGPITNPLSPAILTRRVLGVNHLIPPVVVARAYNVLNERGITHMDHGLFVRGFAGDQTESGMDELSICESGTQVAELKNGEISEYWLRAEDFGIAPIPVESVSPPAGMSKGQFSIAILERKASVFPTQMVIANAALLFYLSGKSSDLKECYALAEEILMSGKAYQRILEVRKMLPAEKK